MIEQEIEKIPKIQFKNQDPHQLQQDQLNHVDYQVHFLPFNLKLNQPAQVETLFNCTIRDYEKQEDEKEQEEQKIGNNKIVQTSLYGRKLLSQKIQFLNKNLCEKQEEKLKQLEEQQEQQEQQKQQENDIKNQKINNEKDLQMLIFTKQKVGFKEEKQLQLVGKASNVYEWKNDEMPKENNRINRNIQYLNILEAFHSED